MMDLLHKITHSLTESAEDMFPDLDNSAFDEHEASESKRTGKFRGLATDRIETLNRQVAHFESLITQQDVLIQRVRQYLSQNNAHKYYSTTNPPAGYTRYGDFPWLRKYPMAEKNFRNYSIHEHSAAISTIEKTIRTVDHAMRRLDTYKPKLKKLKATASRIRRDAAKAELTQQQATAPTERIMKVNIPRKVTIRHFEQVGRSKPKMVSKEIDNPYFEVDYGDVQDEYAGHPAHFDWKARKTMYQQFGAIAKEFKCPAPDTIYIKRRDHKNRLCFYMHNSDKSFQVFVHPSGYELVINGALSETWYSTRYVAKTYDNMRKEITKDLELMKRHGLKP